MILGELVCSGLVNDTDVSCARLRTRKPKYLLRRHDGRVELEAVAVENLAANPNGVLASRHDDRVSVLQLHLRKLTLKQEVVKVERRSFLSGAQEPDVDIAPTRRVDAAGP